MLVMVEEGWERARDARRVANVVLPMHGWPDRIRDGMLKRAPIALVAFCLLLFAFAIVAFPRALFLWFLLRFCGQQPADILGIF